MSKSKKILLFFIFCILSITLYSQSISKLRQEMDAAFQDYMTSLSRDGFYSDSCQKKLVIFQEKKKKLEEIETQNGYTKNRNYGSNEELIRSQSWFKKLINNIKLSYYKTKAIKLGRKIMDSISKGEDPSKYERDLDKIYSKIYKLTNGNNYANTPISTPQPLPTPPPTSSNNNNGNTPTTPNTPNIDYKRLQKIDFYLSKSIRLDKYDVEMILIEFLNFKKYNSRSAMISDFQKANNISVTGQIDDKTKQALLEHLKMIKEAEEKWGSGTELSSKTLPFDKMLDVASREITSLPRISDKYGNSITPQKVLSSLVHAESSYIHRKSSGFTVSKYAQGNCGAIGFTQLMPFTAKSLGVNPYDPEDNMRGGAKYLNGNFNRFQGYYGSNLDNVSKAIAAYNCGPNRSIFKTASWDYIVSRGKIPRESIAYSIKIKSTMSIKLSNTEKSWMVSHGYKSVLIRNGYLNELRKDGYVQ